LLPINSIDIQIALARSRTPNDLDQSAGSGTALKIIAVFGICAEPSTQSRWEVLMIGWKAMTAAGAMSLFAAFATGNAAASPLGLAMGKSLPETSQSDVVQVRSRNVGPAVAAGVMGAIIGGIIASQRPHYDYYGYPAYGYPYPYPAYRPYPYDPAVAYCIQRFRSYDPYSGTYLGNDGRRHSCP
jgi:hypothetical protein